ncbi:MAG: hypothetical protein Q8N79_00865, partial [Candidatus Methanoperedens sp.]|nr:hypothetical protein [Candidatus Methanoperedens sp.]
EKDFPQDWAETLFNLGIALRSFAEETKDQNALPSALAAFRSSARGFRSVGLNEYAEKADRIAAKMEKIS